MDPPNLPAAAGPPDRDRLVLLGTGTCQLLPERRASSVLVEVDGLRVVYDMGRGIADRLAEIGLRQDDVRHVVLSHFHPDHVSDLIPYLQAAAWSRIDPRSEDLHVWGPRGLENQMHRLLGLFDVDNLTRRSWRVRLHELRDDEVSSGEMSTGDGGHPTFEIEGRRFGWPSLPPAGNHGLLVSTDGGPVALTGDSSYHDAEVEALRGCRLAVFDSGHLDDDEIVELAVRSRVPRLLATHVYRELDAERLAERARERGWDGRLEVARDLQVVDLARVDDAAVTSCE